MTDDLRTQALSTYRANLAVAWLGVGLSAAALLSTLLVVNLTILIIAVPFGWISLFDLPWGFLLGLDALFLGILFFEHRRGRGTRFEEVGRGGLDAAGDVYALGSLMAGHVPMGAPRASAAAYLFFGLPRTVDATIDRFRRARRPDPAALEAAIRLATRLASRPNGRLELEELERGDGALNLRTGLDVLVRDLRWAYVGQGPRGPRLVSTRRTGD